MVGSVITSFRLTRVLSKLKPHTEVCVLALRSVRGSRREANQASSLSFAPGFSRIAVRDGIPVSATDVTSKPGLA
jgi:hypothetical protein